MTELDAVHKNVFPEGTLWRTVLKVPGAFPGSVAADRSTRRSRSCGNLLEKTPSEHTEQAALFEWACLNSKAIPELNLLAAVPNGGHRQKAVAGKMKAEGVKAGFPDIIFPVARGGFHGLFVEMKAPMGGTWQKAQKRWAEDLAKQGYLTAICYGWDVAQNLLLEYIKGKLEAHITKNPTIRKSSRTTHGW